MFRRVVVFVMLPCLLLTQSAAFGHAHGGGQPAGHDIRPHFHTTAAPTGHTHEHGHRHPHHHDVDEAAPVAPTTLPPQHPEPQPDHDSDAIYVAVPDGVAVERFELPGGVASALWWPVDDSDPFVNVWADPPAHSILCGCPPPLGSRSCPLYVRHLALLI